MNNLSLKVNKYGDTLSGSLNMDSNKITSSYVPTNNFDQINQIYLRSIYIKNSCGYIPELGRPVFNKNGFTITTSGDATGTLGYAPFTTWKHHWIPADPNNAWIQVECPQSIMIHQFAFCGKRGGGATLLVEYIISVY